MSPGLRILVTGAGGFIGHHLVKRLKTEGVTGYAVRTSASPRMNRLLLMNLISSTCVVHDNCFRATRGEIDQVYHLAGDMGGIGYQRPPAQPSPATTCL